MTLRHRQSRILDLVVTRSAASQATLNEIEENILILGRDHYIFDELWWEGVGRGAMGKNRASVLYYPGPIFYNTYPSHQKAKIMHNLRVAPKVAQPTPTQITMFHPLVALMESRLLDVF